MRGIQEKVREWLARANEHLDSNRVRGNLKTSIEKGRWGVNKRLKNTWNRVSKVTCPPRATRLSGRPVGFRLRISTLV